MDETSFQGLTGDAFACPFFSQVGFASLRLWSGAESQALYCRHICFLNEGFKDTIQNDPVVSLKNTNINKQPMKTPVLALGPASGILAYPVLALFGSF